MDLAPIPFPPSTKPEVAFISVGRDGAVVCLLQEISSIPPVTLLLVKHTLGAVGITWVLSLLRKIVHFFQADA